MRLFVGVWPTDEVCRDIEALERPALRAVRWTTVAQWHVTLAFLGNLDASGVDRAAGALHAAAAGAGGPPTAVLGPWTELLGPGVLCLPVGGLDDLAAGMRRALGTAGMRVEKRPFRGHLTLARSRGDRPVPRRLSGIPLAGEWPVTAVELIRSTLDVDGARYETVDRATIPS